MQTVTLKATIRTQSGKGAARRLRAEGRMPAVAYGKEVDTAAVVIEQDALRDILLSERGRNTIIELQIADGDSLNVMVREYTVHPVSRQLLHVDFVTVSLVQPMEVDVPFRAVGRSKGEAEGGTLLANVRTIRVRCLPALIPDVITYDVTDMVIDDVVQGKDLTLPEGAHALLAPDAKMLTIKPPRVIEEDTPEEEEIDPDAPPPAEGDAPAEEGADGGGDAGAS